jgi:hypothetical protein
LVDPTLSANSRRKGMGHPASVLCIRLQELTVTEIEFPELMSGGLWQALLSAQVFAIAEAE